MESFYHGAPPGAPSIRDLHHPITPPVLGYRAIARIPLPWYCIRVIPGRPELRGRDSGKRPLRELASGGGRTPRLGNPCRSQGSSLRRPVHRWSAGIAFLTLLAAAALRVQAGSNVPFDVGDNDVDHDDYSAFVSCQTGPLTTHDGTQPCLICDSNSDGSPGVVYLRRAASAENLTRWVFHIEAAAPARTTSPVWIDGADSASTRPPR